jgi:hypothetical protein
MRSDELQDAFYAALNVPAVTALLVQGGAYVPIYTSVPQTDNGEDDAEFPYISFGAETTTPFNDKDQLGGSTVAQVDIWTRELDYARCKQIGAAVRSALDRVSLGLTGHITTEFESAVYTPDPDGKTKRGVLLFRILYLG